ncbi:hypothetical protein [Kitasatospora sp. NPDC002040]|uniref:hypothetical protein n=1 Tax=Kitasatospora sp. NPDC002040 TaxID=3154661 RepID=UPI00331D7277
MTDPDPDRALGAARRMRRDAAQLASSIARVLTILDNAEPHLRQPLQTALENAIAPLAPPFLYARYQLGDTAQQVNTLGTSHLTPDAPAAT